MRRQLEALHRYCNAHDVEVVGAFEDRASKASLDRLGLDALREVVSGGGVDVILAQDRDRFSRESSPDNCELDHPVMQATGGGF